MTNTESLNKPNTVLDKDTMSTPNINYDTESVSSLSTIDEDDPLDDLIYDDHDDEDIDDESYDSAEYCDESDEIEYNDDNTDEDNTIDNANNNIITKNTKDSNNDLDNLKQQNAKQIKS